MIRVYDAAGNVIETQKRKGDFKEWCDLPRGKTKSHLAVKHDGSLFRLIEQL